MGQHAIPSFPALTFESGPPFFGAHFRIAANISRATAFSRAWSRIGAG